jgi:hypothetical protein
MYLKLKNNYQIYIFMIYECFVILQTIKYSIILVINILLYIFKIMEIEKENINKSNHHSRVKDEKYNLLKMIQNNDKKYNKIRKMNKEQLSYKSNNPRQGEINTQIYKLYDELDSEFNYFRSLSNSLCFKHKFIKIDKTNRVVQPSLLKNLYIPTKIANYIIDNASVLLEYNCQLDSERTVKINFIIFNNSDYELNNIRKKSASYFKSCVLKIYIWLKILSKYSNKECGKILECFIYLAHFKRKLPQCSNLE